MSSAKVPYSRLRNEIGFDEDAYERDRAICRSRNWFRLRRVSIRKRFRLKVPSLRRILRKRGVLASKFRISSFSWGGILRRLKESQAHFGDLFAGNYLFLQVNPKQIKYIGKAHEINDFPNRQSLPNTA